MPELFLTAIEVAIQEGLPGFLEGPGHLLLLFPVFASLPGLLQERCAWVFCGLTCRALSKAVMA